MPQKKGKYEEITLHIVVRNYGRQYVRHGAHECIGAGIGINIGPVIGLNIHLGSVASIALTGYARYGAYDYSYDSRFGDDGDDGAEYNIGMNVAILFLLGDER